MSLQKIAAEYGYSVDEIEELAQEFLDLEKNAESEQERAHKWGKRGAIANAGVGTAMRAAILAHPKTRRIALKASGSPKSLAARVAVGTAGDALVGYGGGRLTHRIVKGPARPDTEAK
jgi:hypothetical protein